MLHDFLTTNRQLIISRCRAKVAKRSEPFDPTAADHGVPLFLEQLVDTLREEQTTQARTVDAPPAPAPTEIGRAAALHGAELLRRGFSIDQVVHDYGDVCQSVTEIAVEQQVSISTDEFRTLNRCLDNAMADAVASFGSGRESSIDLQVKSLQQRLAAFAVEHQRLTEIAIQAFAAIRTGNVGTSGATGALLAHTLDELRNLKERALPAILIIASNSEAAAA
jgi:hypothetical protein